MSILSAVKGGPNEKRLASQFIARFFRHFPDLAEQALNAQFDLCEDEDMHVRTMLLSLHSAIAAQLRSIKETKHFL